MTALSYCTSSLGWRGYLVHAAASLMYTNVTEVQLHGWAPDAECTRTPTRMTYVTFTEEIPGGLTDCDDAMKLARGPD
eukprot:1150703-Pelagomonas_calceolata.AAC.2